MERDAQSEMTTLQLTQKICIKGKLVLVTGMHIGGSSLGLSIGGVDKVVVRNPFNNEPYIPGSSLKGKLRSLLEKSHGLVQIQGKPSKNGRAEQLWQGLLCSDPGQPLVQLFGTAASDIAESASPLYAPTRLTVRDGRICNIDAIEEAGNTDMYGTEIKTEVSIDRLTSAANPRNFERVPGGAIFDLNLVVDIYEKLDAENADIYLQLLAEGLQLLEDDYLGGQGSRGYGQVKVFIDSVLVKTSKDYFEGTSGHEDTNSRSRFFSSFPPLPEKETTAQGLIA